MIVKEKAITLTTDRLEKAGDDAERKVAYYLKMAFGDEPRLLVLNDLRVEFEDGITAQMDHLLIHQYGLIIIESKSVAGRLQVHDDGQWVRWYRDPKAGKDRSIGMQNPIKQAKLQGQTLRRVLFKSASDSTRKVLSEFPIDVLVSISDTGVFLAHDRSLYPEVCKADQLEDRVKEIVLNRSKTAKESDFRLSDTNKLKLAEHLVAIHKPYHPDICVVAPKIEPKTQAIAPKAEQKVSDYIVPNTSKATGILGTIVKALADPDIKFKHACRKCKSDNMEIRYAKNYFFRCLDCDTNNRIDAECPNCNRSLKIRKDRNRFFAECSACGTSEIFHINK